METALVKVYEENEARERGLIVNVGDNVSNVSHDDFYVLYKRVSVERYYNGNRTHDKDFACRYYIVDKHCKVSKVFKAFGPTISECIKQVNVLLTEYSFEKENL